MTSHRASTDHPIQALLAERWSPYAFSERAVPRSELASLFEAARWAASSYNEQPWSYIVATRDDPGEHARLLSALVEANQQWARHAPVLALGLVTTPFRRNAKPNKAARHDLGAASASLTFEATARGLVVHQMIGIEPEKARDLYAIPDGTEAFTGLAIGYPAGPGEGPDEMAERDRRARERRPLAEFLFGGAFGQPWRA